MNALRPSFRNDSFVSLVAGILVAAMMLVGGPTAWAASRMLASARISPPCDGSLTVPPEVQAWLDVQCSIRQAIFGDQADPGTCLESELHISAPGLYSAWTWQAENVLVDAAHTVQLDLEAHSPELFALGVEIAVVFGTLVGDSGSIPAWGLSISGYPDSVEHAFVIGGTLTQGQLDELSLATELQSRYSGSNRPDGQPVWTQEQCVKFQYEKYHVAMDNASDNLSICTAAIMGGFGLCMAACISAVIFFTPAPLAVVGCSAACLAEIVIGMAACTAVYSAAVEEARRNLEIDLLESCGVTLAHD